MGKTKNTIEINGHLYDATTGVQVGAGSSQPHPAAHKSVDGVIAHAKPAQHHPSQTANKPIRPPAPSKKATRRNAAPAAKRKVEHSHTLMRHAVKKPAASQHVIKTQNDASALIKQPEVAVAPKLSVRHIKPSRLKHAKQTRKSQAVSRFGSSYVASAPVAVSAHKAAPPQQAKSSARPRPSTKPAHTDIFEQAIHHATSHRQPAPKKTMSRRQRVAGYSVLAVITLTVLGVLGSQGLTGLQVHMASAKAGFAASLPGYKPAGYSLGKLDYSAGAVAMNYKSNSDQSRKFVITQKSSAWDSTTLRDTFVQDTDKNYQAVDVNGRTVYLYGEDSATWVDNGVWYRVQGDGSLSSRQLVDIAKSL